MVGTHMAGALLIGGIALASPAGAAGLTQISDFGSNPGSLNMYISPHRL
ncbi:hypothetical protein ACQP1W_24690 [Spirillospora sp. CA-255316]